MLKEALAQMDEWLTRISLDRSTDSTRGVAGSPLAADVIKCQLKAVSASDYKVTFTADELARLKQAFAGGVCDWSKPGVEQQPLAGTWQALPASPANTATR